MGTDIELLKYVAPLGVGGILAWGIFLLYRKDAAKWAEQETKRGDTMTGVVVDNTRAITELVVTLRDNRKP